MFERLIGFVVLGFFVFSPNIPDWSASYHWFAIYFVWLLVILLAAWQHSGSRRASP